MVAGWKRVRVPEKRITVSNAKDSFFFSLEEIEENDLKIGVSVSGGLDSVSILNLKVNWNL